jgi:hypothetical protein
MQVTGTTFSLSKVEKDKKGGAAAAGAACGAADAEEAGAPEPSAADKLAGAVDASLFLDEDVELPSDDDDDE